MEDRKNLEVFKDEELGLGQFGIVFKGKYKNNIDVAVKIMDKQYNNFIEVEKEFKLMKV